MTHRVTRHLTARRTAYLLTAVLAVYLAVVGWRGWQLVADGRPPFVLLGVGVLLLPALGAWFVWQELRFGEATGRLAGALAAEGGLPEDRPPRSRGGRMDRAAADAAFTRRRAEVEQAPDDWRPWYRLAMAYAEAGDVRRGRRAMRHAIRLYDAQRER
jgi:cytochrome c-type biogenesis protein CcmH/NrfG